MMRTCLCGDEIAEARWALGYRTCLDCGAAQATIKTERLKQCAAPAFNKGPLQPMMTRQDALDAGRK